MFKVIYISNIIKTAPYEEQAKQIHETLYFDRVPIKGQHDNIETYYDSNTNKIQNIESSDLISESSGLLETFLFYFRW